MLPLDPTRGLPTLTCGLSTLTRGLSTLTWRSRFASLHSALTFANARADLRVVDYAPSADFNFENSRGNLSNYLDLNTSTLTGLIYNATQEITEKQKDIDSWEPWAAIRDAHADLKKGEIDNTVRAAHIALASLLII